MSRRINIVLPEETIRALDRMAKPGQRSNLINRAVQHFFANRSVEALRTRLEQTLLRDRDLDREVAADWLAVDQQAWRQLEEPRATRRPAARSAARSTSRRSIRR